MVPKESLSGEAKSLNARLDPFDKSFGQEPRMKVPGHFLNRAAQDDTTTT